MGRKEQKGNKRYQEGLKERERERALPFDITKSEDIDTACEWVGEHWGTVDVLIHNAGLFSVVSLSIEFMA